MAERCSVRESLGAYVLGHLDPVEEAAVSAHLEACPACAADLPGLSATAALLAAAGPVGALPVDDATARDPVPPDLVERVVARVGAQRAHRRQRRVRALLAAAAAVVVLAGAAVAVPRLLGEPESLEQVVLASPAGAQATATLRPWDWGTGIHVEATGLEPGDVYGVWLADEAGRRLSAGTFVALEGGEVECYLTSAMLRPQAARVGVTDLEDGTDVLAAPLR